MVEPTGTTWPVLPVQSFLPSRHTERGVRLNQIGHSSGMQRQRYFGCNRGQISLNNAIANIAVTCTQVSICYLNVGKKHRTTSFLELQLEVYTIKYNSSQKSGHIVTGSRNFITFLELCNNLYLKIAV